MVCPAHARNSSVVEARTAKPVVGGWEAGRGYSFHAKP